MLVASRLEQAELLEEEQQLQEAIRLSMLEIENEDEVIHATAAAASSIEDQPRERSTRMKRKAEEEELRTNRVKRLASLPTSMSSSSSRPTSLAEQPCKHIARRIALPKLTCMLQLLSLHQKSR